MNVFDYFFEHTSNIDKDFVLGAKETISYKELFRCSISIANYLNENTDLGENILLISPNNVFFIKVYLGILKSGRVCIPVNPDVEAGNLHYIIEQCRAKKVFIPLIYADRFDLTGLNKISEAQVNELKSDFILPKISDFDENRCAEIIFTSGSTGTPKGVMLSHKNIISNTNSIIEYLELDQHDIIEIVMPFYYCYGLSLLHTHIRVGGSVVLNNTFIFIGSVLNDLNKYNCTGFAGVPSHYQILLRKSESFKITHFPSLRYMSQAGGKLHNVFIQEFLDSHPEIDFYIMYGQTEATARLSYLPKDRLPEKIGSIGKGIPGVELNVVDESGEKINPGETGEIIARGNNIMLGYINDPLTTKEVIKEGWLYTGDLATIDDEGYIYIKARQKEIIKVGGKRISPKEIEEVIVSIPEVIDCTILAIEDDLLGEAIKAKITIDRENQQRINADYIRRFCAVKLAPYKIPQVIEIVDKISVSATGKKVKTQNNLSKNS